MCLFSTIFRRNTKLEGKVILSYDQTFTMKKDFSFLADFSEFSATNLRNNGLNVPALKVDSATAQCFRFGLSMPKKVCNSAFFFSFGDAVHVSRLIQHFTSVTWSVKITLQNVTYVSSVAKHKFKIKQRRHSDTLINYSFANFYKILMFRWVKSLSFSSFC